MTKPLRRRADPPRSRDSRVGDGDLSVTDSGFTRSYTGALRGTPPLGGAGSEALPRRLRGVRLRVVGSDHAGAGGESTLR